MFTQIVAFGLAIVGFLFVAFIMLRSRTVGQQVTAAVYPEPMMADLDMAPAIAYPEQVAFSRNDQVFFPYCGQMRLGRIERLPRCEGSKRLVLSMDGRSVHRKVHQLERM